MKTVTVQLQDRSYNIIIDQYILEMIGDYLHTHYPVKRVAVITDENVKELYADKVMSSIRQAKMTATVHTINPGETSKSWDVLNQLHTELIKSNLRRDGLILALGGGVVGDLAGFTASTYLRGVPFIQIPTTLLAQVDSSVGGKTGINHPLGKNLVGSFHQPRLVLIDPMTLNTLDKREFWSGMAEVIKYGLIWDKDFFHMLCENKTTISSLSDWEQINEMIAKCCEIKAEVVNQDEKESGLRRILNFGHTLGHAIEAAAGYDAFRHGEAVIWGMRWAAWVSNRKSYITDNDFETIENFLLQIPVPSLPKELNASILAEKTKLDKKQTTDGLNLVLLKDIGKTHIEQCDNAEQLIEEWLHGIRG